MRALISASNLHRRELCPGSANAENGLPDLPESDAAAQGTEMHRREAEQDWAGLEAYSQRAIEKNARAEDDFIYNTFAALGRDYSGPTSVWVEREFNLCDADGLPVVPTVPGHADKIVYYKPEGIAFVFDSKFGRAPVPQADMNLQLACYAVQVWDELVCERIYVAIRQPYLPPPHDFHSAEYTANEIAGAREHLLRIIAAARQPDAPRKPSLDACFFCGARGTPRCPESTNLAKDLIIHKISELAPRKLESLAHAMLLAERIVEGWRQRMEYIAAEWPDILETYGLSKPQTTESVENVMEAMRRLSDAGLLGGEGREERFLSCCKLSLPKLCTELAGFLERKPQEVEGQIKDALGDLIIHTPRKRFLVKK